ncbi:hypothetical protein B9Z19DRAFT_813272 [Tuber borchii]|uniref:Uncharacterized protein n=1 Tax=Tuber borchii TaxID=42251 RepID=A0A2T6ZVQ1_TUBBO|nr:hypothetical protein B9Z19DRAFT_813272 [Tuber borchii]
MEERSRREEQERVAEYRRRMEMEQEKARVRKLEEERKAVMALQLKREEDGKRIQLERQIAFEREREREREREARAAEEKRRNTVLFEMRKLEEAEFERRMFMQRERSKQLREQALQRAQYEFQRARQAEEEEKRRIQIQIEAEEDLRRKQLVEEEEKRLTEHREKKRMEEEVARQLYAQAEAEKLRVKLQKQQEEERRLNMEEEMTRTLQAQIEAEKVKEDQRKRGEEEEREYKLQVEERKRTIATVEAKRRDAEEFQMIEQEIELERGRKAEEERKRAIAAAEAKRRDAEEFQMIEQEIELERERKAEEEEHKRTIATIEAKRKDAEEFQMIEQEIELERERKAEEERLIQMEVDRRLAAERAERERIDLEAKAAELKAQMAVLAAQQKEARETRRRKRKADPNYGAREVSRNRERSRERETEREKARREQVEMIRKNAGLDEKPSKSKRNVSFAELPMKPVEFVEPSWTVPGGVPKLVQTAPTPPPGTPKTPLLVHVDPSSYFPPTEKEKESESSKEQLGVQESEAQGSEIGSPEVVVASPPPSSPEVGFSILDKDIAIGKPFTGIPVAPQPNNAMKTAETVIAIGIAEESHETEEEQRGRRRNVYYGPMLPENYQFRKTTQQESFYGPELPTDYFSAVPGPSISVAEPVYFDQSPPVAYGPPLPDDYKPLKRSDSGSSEEGRFHSPAEFTEVELKDHSSPPPAYDGAVSGASSMYVVNTAEVSLDNTAEVSRDGSWENLASGAVLESRKGKQAMAEEVVEAIESKGWKNTEVYGESASLSVDRSKSSGVISEDDIIYGPELPEGPTFERSKSETAMSVHEEGRTEVLGSNASYYGSTPEQFLQKVEEAARAEAAEAQKQNIVYGPPLPQDYSFGTSKPAPPAGDRSLYSSDSKASSQTTVTKVAENSGEFRSYSEQSRFEGSSESYTLESGSRSEQVAPELVAYGPPLPDHFVFRVNSQGRSSSQRGEEQPSPLDVSESHTESRHESHSTASVSRDNVYYGPSLPEGFEFKKAISSKRRSRRPGDERPTSYSSESRSESRVTTGDASDTIFGPPLPEVKKKSSRSERRSSRDVSASSSTDSVVYGPALPEDMQLRRTTSERRSRTTFDANVPPPTENQAAASEGHRLRRSQTERVKPQHGVHERPRSYMSDARSSAETLDHRQGAPVPEGRRLRRSNTERAESRRSHEERSGVLSEFKSRPDATTTAVSGATDVQYQTQPIPAMPEERELKRGEHTEVLDERSTFYSSESRSSDATTTFVGSSEGQAQVQTGRGMPPMPDGHRLKRTQTERVDTRHALADERSTSYSSESSSGAAAGSLERRIRLTDTPGAPPVPEGPRLKRSQTERVDIRHPAVDPRSAVIEERATSYSSESRSGGVTASVSGSSEHHQTQSATVPGIPQMPEGQRLKRSQTERVDPRPVAGEAGASYSSESRVESRSGAEGTERGRAFPEGHRLKRSTTERARPTKTRPTADERAPFYSSEARARSDEFIAQMDGAPNITEGFLFQQSTSSSSINSQAHGYDSSRTKSGYSADVTSASESEFATPPTGGTMDNTPTATTRNTPVSRQNAPGSREGSRSVTPRPPSRKSTEEKKQEDREFTAIAMAAAEDAGFNPGLVLSETITATPEATKPPTPVDQRSIEGEDTKGDRSRSLSRLPQVLRSGSRSKSRRQRTGSLFGRSKTSDSMSSDSRADSMTPGSGGVSIESSPPAFERRSTDTPRKMSLTASVISGMKRMGGSGDKSHPQGGPGEVERTPHSTPPASIMDGFLPGRRSRKSSVTYHSDDSQMMEETERLAAGSGTESKKEKKERIEREKKEKREEKEREKREKKEEKERSASEAGSPESGKSRWGGLFGKLGVKQSPSTSPSKPPGFANVVQRAMTEPTKIPSLPTRSGSDEGETHTRPTTSSGKSFRSFAGIFGGGKLDHHATDSASAASVSIHNESLTSQDPGRPSFDASQSDHVEARTATLSGPQEEVSNDGVRLRGFGEVDKGTIETSDQAGIQVGEKKKTGIPLPRGGLRRGRSAEFAGLSGRGSLDERGLPSPIPELLEGRDSWRNSRDLGLSLDQVAGINRADTRTPEQIPLPTPDLADGDQDPETRIPQPSASSGRKGLARKKKTGDLAAASSESIDSLPEQHQSGDVNDTEVRMESRLPQIRRTESLKVKT